MLLYFGWQPCERTNINKFCEILKKTYKFIFERTRLSICEKFLCIVILALSSSVWIKESRQWWENSFDLLFVPSVKRHASCAVRQFRKILLCWVIKFTTTLTTTSTTSTTTTTSLLWTFDCAESLRHCVTSHHSSHLLGVLHLFPYFVLMFQSLKFKHSWVSLDTPRLICVNSYLAVCWSLRG